MSKISISENKKQHLNAWLENLSSLSILQWAIDVFSPQLVATSSFGLNGVALIHILQKITKEVPIIFVNTGYMFEETLKTKRRIESTYGVKILTFHPSLSIKEQNRKFGSALFIHHPDICCALRKFEPMQRALSALKPKVVLNGRARFQAETRQNLQIIEWEKKPIQINPLAAWSYKQIETYVKEYRIPYNSLFDIGYCSIGCRPCTRQVLKHEHIRAGRWAELDRIECGLWTRNYS